MSTIAERFMKLFRGYELRHGQYTVVREELSGKMSGRAETVDTAPSLKDYQEHLDGVKGIGIIPLTNNNTAYFSAIDIDNYSMDINDLVWRVRKLPVFVTRSKSGGAHIWLFCPEGAPAELVVHALKHWAGELGVAGSEIFPKQVSRASKEDVGNWINLPYFGDSRRCIVVADEKKQTFKELNVEEFLDFVEKYAGGVNIDYLKNSAPKVTSRSEKGSKQDFVDGPKCLETIWKDGPPEGGRNNYFFNLAVYLFRKYNSVDTVEAKCIAYNEQLGDSKLPPSEIKAAVKSATRKEYGYNCQQEPLKSFCQRSECLKRTFGVGSRTTDLPFEIGGFSKILTNPPMYCFNVDGIRVVIKSSHELLNQKRFRAHIVDASSKIMPILQQHKFDELMQDWLDHSEDVIPPPDADPRTQILDALKEFIEGRSHVQKDRILKGHAFVDDEAKVVYFRINDFKRYLKQNHVAFDDRELHQYLREQMSVIYSDTDTEIKGENIKLWSVPTNKVISKTEDKPVETQEVF